MASALWKRGRQTSATKPVSVIRSFSHGSDLDPTESEWDAILAGGNEKLFRDVGELLESLCTIIDLR